MMPNMIMMDGSQQVPSTRGCQALSRGVQLTQKKRAPSPSRMLMLSMANQRKYDIQPSDTESKVRAKDVLLQDWLVMASVVEHIPKRTSMLRVSTDIREALSNGARSVTTVTRIALPSKAA